MIYIIILAIGVLGALLLGAQALGGPNPRKALKRRMVADASLQRVLQELAK